MSDTMGKGQEETSNGSIFGATGASVECLEDAAHEYGRKIADVASHARDFVSDKATVVGDKIKDLQNKDLGEVLDNAKDYARKNPGQAILISAAAGMLLGLIIRGRR